MNISTCNNNMYSMFLTYLMLISCISSCLAETSATPDEELFLNIVKTWAEESGNPIEYIFEPSKKGLNPTYCREDDCGNLKRDRNNAKRLKEQAM